MDGRAHEGVPGSAELGALDRDRCPIRVGVTRSVVVMPGTASSFSENSGTKKLWITSSERSLNTTGWPLGR